MERSSGCAGRHWPALLMLLALGLAGCSSPDTAPQHGSEPPPSTAGGSAPSPTPPTTTAQPVPAPTSATDSGVTPEVPIQTQPPATAPADWPPQITGAAPMMAGTSTFTDAEVSFIIPADCAPIPAAPPTVAAWSCGGLAAKISVTAMSLADATAGAALPGLQDTTTVPAGQAEVVVARSSQDPVTWVADTGRLLIVWQADESHWGPLGFTPSFVSLQVGVQ